MSDIELFWGNTELNDLKNEIWLDVPDYDGIYQVSNLGRVKSLKREYYRKGVNVPLYTEEKILKQTLTLNKRSSMPQLYVSFSVNGIRKTFTVNNLIGITFIGDKKKTHHFQHKNKNSLDNRLVNIEQVSIYESKSNDFKHNKREPHNYKHLPKAKYKIIREDGKAFTFSDIVKEYGRAAYFNILKGQNVRGYKWDKTYDDKAKP